MLLITITIWFLLSTASLSFILFISIQKDQWLDNIFQWQNMLRKWDISGTKKGMMLYKIMGGCELCFSHFIAFLTFWIFILVQTYFTIGMAWWMYPLLYFGYVPLATNLNLLFITKLFK